MIEILPELGGVLATPEGGGKDYIKMSLCRLDRVETLPLQFLLVWLGLLMVRTAELKAKITIGSVNQGTVVWLGSVAVGEWAEMPAAHTQPLRKNGSFVLQAGDDLCQGPEGGSLLLLAEGAGRFLEEARPIPGPRYQVFPCRREADGHGALVILGQLRGQTLLHER